MALQARIRAGHDTHAKFVYWSDEDKCFIGMCPSLFLGGVHGSDERKVYDELCKEVVEWEAIHRRRNRVDRRSSSSSSERTERSNRFRRKPR